jgi:Zn-dependent peptidase ImmA (M78 family)/transcriptional regulator with XRE-family HTH domain
MLKYKKNMSISDIDPQILGKRIKELRRRRSWTQAELAGKVGICTGPMNALENGHHLPSLPVFSKLAAILECDANLLLRDALPAYARQITAPDESASVCEAYMRVTQNAWETYQSYNADILRFEPYQQALTEDTLTHINQVVLGYLSLEDICGVQKKALIPLQMNLPDSISGLESFARRIRGVFGVSDAVIFDYLELFENCGLRVVFMPLAQNVQSVSCYDRKNGNAFFFIDPSHNVERQIFVLCYELGRIYLYNGGMRQQQRIGGKDFDHAARYFAAMFLMPEEAVIRTVSQVGVSRTDWSWDMVMRLKHRFGVSAEAFLYRLDDLDLISAEGKADLKNQIKQYYATHGALSEPDQSRRILSPNGRIGDLLLRASQLRKEEAVEIRKTLLTNNVKMN